VSTARVQALFARACLGPPEVAEALARDPAAFAASHGLEGPDVEAVVAASKRIGLYRRLVRGNLTGVVCAMLERTRARFDAHRPGLFDATVDAFLAEASPRTSHLRDVPSEMLAFAAPRWRADPNVPAFLIEHAEVELVEFTVGAAPRPPAPPALADVAPDLPLVFAEPTAMVRATHAVHEVPADDLAAQPAARPTALLVYRDAEHRTRFLELTPLAAEILERLRAGRALAPAMVEAAGALGVALDETVLAGAARLLADLGARGVLLGARAAGGHG
jgi:hypothetical protein